MKYEIGFVDNPRFESITGLTNTTFDPDNIQEDRMASEAQVLAAWNASADLEMEVERCCKDMRVWETYVQIVRLNNNTLKNYGANNYGIPSAGGIVISPFHNNRRAGIMRQGEIYTVTFSLPFNNDIYAPYTAVAGTDGLVYNIPSASDNKNIKLVQYRLLYDASISLPKASVGTNVANRRSGFLRFEAFNNPNASTNGLILNNQGNWTSFSHNVGNDGVVSITASGDEAEFTVVRFYTQWTLRECLNGSLLPNPT